LQHTATSAMPEASVRRIDIPRSESARSIALQRSKNDGNST